MQSNIASAKHVKMLSKPKKKSHKGENGVLLILAGSKQYHGAAVFAGLTASRIVDLVYFCTEKENISFVKKSSPEFIVSETKDYKKWVGKSSAVLIGPGLATNEINKKIIAKILEDFKDKKTVLDATAFHLISPRQLHSNCIITPHAQEFFVLFKQKPAKKNIKKFSKKLGCVIVLKGATDIIASNGKLYYNFTGNEGMTKGGTGDVLAGLIAGFACKNPLLLSCLAGCFLNGFAGDLLKKEKGLMYNALDLMEKLPEAKKICEKT